MKYRFFSTRFCSTLGLLSLLVMGVLGCADTGPSVQGSNTAQPESPVAASPRVKASTSPKTTPQKSDLSKALTPDTAPPISLYTADSQCNLVERKVAVAANKPMEAAIAQILKTPNARDMTIASYQVKVANGVATVDLQPSASSRRRFDSLSACEQTALFGSIEQTLTANARWKIREVHFTEKGKDLQL